MVPEPTEFVEGSSVDEDGFSDNGNEPHSAGKADPPSHKRVEGERLEGAAEAREERLLALAAAATCNEGGDQGAALGHRGDEIRQVVLVNADVAVRDEDEVHHGGLVPGNEVRHFRVEPFLGAADP